MKIDRSFKVVADYVNWVFKQYKELKKNIADTPPLKIIDFNYSDKENSFVFTVQIHEKNVFTKFKLDYLIEDKTIMEKFSLEDIQLIKAVAEKKIFHQNSNAKNIDIKETSKLKGKIFDRENKKNLFVVVNNENGVEFVKRMYAEEISQDKNKLHSFNKDDIYEISHAEGAESILLEKKELDKLRNELV